MPPYESMHVENLWWVFAGGTLLALVIALARGVKYLTFTLRPRSDEELEADTHEFGGGVREQNKPMPWLIWLIGIGYFIWAIAYVVFSGARGLQ